MDIKRAILPANIQMSSETLEPYILCVCANSCNLSIRILQLLEVEGSHTGPREQGHELYLLNLGYLTSSLRHMFLGQNFGLSTIFSFKPSVVQAISMGVI